MIHSSSVQVLTLLLFILVPIFAKDTTFVTKVFEYDTERFRAYDTFEKGAYYTTFDSKGNLWFAQSQGVGRMKDSIGEIYTYGTNFQAFYSYINDLAIDKDDRVWAVSDDGIFYYEDSLWTKMKRSSYSGIPADNADEILVTDSLIWVVFSGIPKNIGNMQISADTIAYFDGNQWVDTTTMPFHYISQIFEDKNKNVWVRYADSLVNLFDQSIVYAPNVKTSFSNVVVDSLNRFWLTGKGEIQIFEDGKFRSLDIPDVEKALGSIVIDSSGVIWFTCEHGLGKIVNDSISYITTSNSNLPSNNINSLEVDREGNLWFNATGYYFNGLVMMADTTFTTFTKKTAAEIFPGINGEVKNIVVEKDSIPWFLIHDCGTTRYVNGKWEPITTENSDLLSNLVYDICFKSDSSIWFATDSGISIKKGTEWSHLTPYNSKLKDRKVSRLLEDTMGRIIIGYETNGFAILEDGTFSNYLLSSDIFGNNYWSGNINDICIDKQNVIWLGTDDGYLKFTDSTHWRWFERNIYKDVESKVRIADMAISNDNILWSVSNKGIITHSLDTDSSTLMDSPILSKRFTRVRIMEDNIKWFGVHHDTKGKGGIYSFNDTSWTITSNSEFNQTLALDILSNGEIWLSSGHRGVFRVMPKDEVILSKKSSKASQFAIQQKEDRLRLTGNLSSIEKTLIVSLSGRVLSEQDLQSHNKEVLNISLGDYASGIYVLLLQSKENIVPIRFRVH